MVFGGIAILSTTFGIDLGGAEVNTRDASILSAGLVFGGPAGIVAGFIGGIHRKRSDLFSQRGAKHPHSKINLAFSFPLVDKKTTRGLQP